MRGFKLRDPGQKSRSAHRQPICLSGSISSTTFDRLFGTEIAKVTVASQRLNEIISDESLAGA